MIGYLLSVILLICSVDGYFLSASTNPKGSLERFNFFDSELFQLLSQREEDNVVVSPAGVKLLLGLLMEGAEGVTMEELRSALRLSCDTDSAQEEFHSWLSSLQKSDKTSFVKMANHIFLSDRYEVNPQYSHYLEKYYKGGITKLDFRSTNHVLSIINGWVANETSYVIPSIIEESQINPDIQMLLTNAIYFKGIWEKSFPSEKTKSFCFYPKPEICQRTPMMHTTGTFKYGYVRELQAQAIQLPYKNEEYSMLILLPSKKEGLRQLHRDLTHVTLNHILSLLKEEEVSIRMPKFVIEYNTDLVEDLKNLGISEIFTNRANFRKIFLSTSGFMTNFIHSTKVTVDEKGSEAASASGALFIPLMSEISVEFFVDRPFSFFILSSGGNSILFAGNLVTPIDPSDCEKEAIPLDYTTKTSSTLCHRRTDGTEIQTQSGETLDGINMPGSNLSPSGTKTYEMPFVTYSTNRKKVSFTYRSKSFKPMHSSYKTDSTHSLSNPEENNPRSQSPQHFNLLLTPSSLPYPVQSDGGPQGAPVQLNTESRGRLPPENNNEKFFNDDQLHHTLVFS